MKNSKIKVGDKVRRIYNSEGSSIENYKRGYTFIVVRISGEHAWEIDKNMTIPHVLSRVEKVYQNSKGLNLKCLNDKRKKQLEELPF